MWLEDMNEYTDLTTKHNGQPEGMITKHTKPRWRYCLYKLHTILNGGVLFAMMTATVFTVATSTACPRHHGLQNDDIVDAFGAAFHRLATFHDHIVFFSRRCSRRHGGV